MDPKQVFEVSVVVQLYHESSEVAVIQFDQKENYTLIHVSNPFFYRSFVSSPAQRIQTCQHLHRSLDLLFAVSKNSSDTRRSYVLVRPREYAYGRVT